MTSTTKDDLTKNVKNAVVCLRYENYENILVMKNDFLTENAMTRKTKLNATLFMALKGSRPGLTSEQRNPEYTWLLHYGLMMNGESLFLQRIECIKICSKHRQHVEESANKTHWKMTKAVRGNLQKKRVYLKTLSKQVGGWSKPFHNFFNEPIFDIRWGQIPFW